MIVESIKELLWPNLGIDLGSANTRIYEPGRGVVLDEPSAICFSKDTGKVLYVGKDAGELVGRSPRDVDVICPIKNGCITDFNAAVAMLTAFVERALKAKRHFRAIVGLPSSATQLDRRAIHDVCRSAGAVHVDLVDSGLAAAYGAGLFGDGSGHARLVVDIGAGVTNVTVVAAGEIISSRSVSSGVEQMNAAIRDLVRSKYEICLGELAANEVLREIGIVERNDNKSSQKSRFNIAGKHPVTGFAETIEITAMDIQEATDPVIDQIVETVRAVIEETPPDVTTDVGQAGLVLTGGGVLIEGISDRLQAKLNLHIASDEDPLHAVARGIGLLFVDSTRLERISLLPDKAAPWENEENLAIN